LSIFIGVARDLLVLRGSRSPSGQQDDGEHRAARRKNLGHAPPAFDLA